MLEGDFQRLVRGLLEPDRTTRLSAKKALADFFGDRDEVVVEGVEQQPVVEVIELE